MQEETKKEPERQFSSKGLSRTGWFLTPNRFGVCKSSDERVYVVAPGTATLKRAHPKVRGKAARRADKLARRQK